MSSETIVSVTNADGERLTGILHVPERPRNVGINLLSPGLKNRVAPNRLYVRLARVLAREGFHVLRMDPAGVGDSDGSLPQAPVVDLWGEIQQGRFVRDAVAMNDFLLARSGKQRLILGGSCGGAITALLSAEKDRRVGGLLLIDLPVTLSSTKTSQQDYLSIIQSDAGYRGRLTSYYLTNLFKPAKWLRVLTFKSDFRAITAVLRLALRRRGSPSESLGAETRVANLNAHVPRAVGALVSRRAPIIFMCAAKDTDTQLFYRGFRDIHLGSNSPWRQFCGIEEIPEANHAYTVPTSQDELIRRTTAWLEMITRNTARVAG